MKKFDLDQELENLKKKKNTSFNRSILSNVYVPFLVIGCSCLALLGATFSLKLTQEEGNEYLVKVDIINGDATTYSRIVKEGAFSDTITSNNEFGSIECTSGKLTYDPLTSTISSPYINQNTSCIISFMDSEIKELKYNGLSTVYDQLGLSYYYKSNANNNYVTINGLSFRIVRINGDGTYRLMLSENIGSYNYANGDVYKALNDWYQRNFGNVNYVVKGVYDDTESPDLEDDSLVNFVGYTLKSVGLLSAKELKLIISDVAGDSLNSMTGFYLENLFGEDSIYAYQNGELVTVSLNSNLGVRPVINVKGTLIGTGTISDPYTLKEE